MGLGSLARPNGFARTTQEAALARQKGLCASCGTPISRLGNAGRAEHAHGEGAHAHHMLHVRLGGLGTLDNCVILCASCHDSAHEGGNYRSGTVTSDASDYPHFHG